MNDLETVNMPAVSATQQSTATGETPITQLPDVFSLLNHMLDRKLITALITKQKIQYSILSFKEFNAEWMLCEVENLAGSVAGDDLVICVQKQTPVVLYFHQQKSPFN